MALGKGERAPGEVKQLGVVNLLSKIGGIRIVVMAISELREIAQLNDIRLTQDLACGANALFAGATKRAEHGAGRTVGGERNPYERLEHRPQTLRHLSAVRTWAIEKCADQRVATIMFCNKVVIDVPKLDR